MEIAAFVIVAWLINADTVITKYAINKYGVDVEGNKLMRMFMRIDYKFMWIFSISLTVVIYYVWRIGLMGAAGWIVNIVFWGALLVQNMNSIKTWRDK